MMTRRREIGLDEKKVCKECDMTKEKRCMREGEGEGEGEGETEYGDVFAERRCR